MWNYCKKISRREVEPQRRQVKWIWCSSIHSFIHSFIEWRLCSGDTNTFRILHWRNRLFFCFSVIRWRFKTISPITESVGPVESGWTCCGLQNHLQSFVYLRLAYLPPLFVCSSVNSVVQPPLAVCISSVFVLFAIAAPLQRTSIKKIFNVKRQRRGVSGILIFFYNDFRGFQDPWNGTRAGDFPRLLTVVLPHLSCSRAGVSSSVPESHQPVSTCGDSSCLLSCRACGLALCCRRATVDSGRVEY